MQRNLCNEHTNFDLDQGDGAAACGCICLKKKNLDGQVNEGKWCDENPKFGAF
jgi:hypothetical protein